MISTSFRKALRPGNKRVPVFLDVMLKIHQKNERLAHICYFLLVHAAGQLVVPEQQLGAKSVEKLSREGKESTVITGLAVSTPEQ